MVLDSVLISFVMALLTQAVPTSQDSAVPIKDRISLLQYKIQEQIRDSVKFREAATTEKKIVKDDYDYVDVSKMKLTPIMSNDQRKKDHKYRMKLLKTSTTTPSPGFDTKTKARTGEPEENQEQTANKSPKGKRKKLRKEKPKDIFYRRAPVPKRTNESHVNYRWTHCQDMVTPYLTGVKCNLTRPRRLDLDDNTVRRVIDLINTDTTNYTRQDIEALMYQLSNLNIRLYQWDLMAVKKLMNVISDLILPNARMPHEHKASSYWSLKHGLAQLFKNWNLDLGDTVQLLEDTKIIRPYCTAVNVVAMSTLKTRPSMYTTPSGYVSESEFEDK